MGSISAQSLVVHWAQSSIEQNSNQRIKQRWPYLTWWRNITEVCGFGLVFTCAGKFKTTRWTVLSGYLFGFAIKLLSLKALFYKQMGFSTITNGIKLKSCFGYLTMNPSTDINELLFHKKNEHNQLEICHNCLFIVFLQLNTQRRRSHCKVIFWY